MENNVIDMNLLNFWHRNPCDHDETPGGICAILGVESVQNRNVLGTFQELEKLSFEESIPLIKHYKNLGEEQIYSLRDRTKIVIKRIQGTYYISEGYHRVFALLLLDVQQLRLDLVTLEIFDD
jgi:hypothetical protein